MGEDASVASPTILGTRRSPRASSASSRPRNTASRRPGLEAPTDDPAVGALESLVLVGAGGGSDDDADLYLYLYRIGSWTMYTTHVLLTEETKETKRVTSTTHHQTKNAQQQKKRPK